MRLELQSALSAELTEANLRGMAFDGSYFYVPLPATRQVQKLDRQLGTVATLSVSRRYDLLYWDERGGVFWAASAEVPRTVFRLSPTFALQETVTLATASCDSTAIRSIGVNCKSNRLLITTASCVTEYEKSGAFVATRLRTGAGVTLQYVLTVTPYTLISYTKNGRNFLELTDASGTNLGDIRTPRGVCLGALLFDPRSAPASAAAYVAAWRGNRTMVLRQPLCVIPDACNFETDAGVGGESTCNCGCNNWNNCGCGNVGGANTCNCGCTCGCVDSESENNCHLCGNVGGANTCNCCTCCCKVIADSCCHHHHHDCDDEDDERTPCQSAVAAADDILGAVNQINDALAQLLKECCDVSDDNDEDGGGCHRCGGGEHHHRPRPGKACNLGGNSHNRLHELEQLLLSQLQTVQETESPVVIGEEGTPCPAVTTDQSRNASATDLVFVG